jgi:multisubunit Na+/H+ antiporter MnhE subunit
VDPLLAAQIDLQAANFGLVRELLKVLVWLFSDHPLVGYIVVGVIVGVVAVFLCARIAGPIRRVYRRQPREP